MKLDKQKVKDELAPVSGIATRLSTDFEKLAKDEPNGGRDYKDSLVAAILAYAESPTQENYDMLKSVVDKPASAEVDKASFLQKIISEFSLEITPKTNTRPKPEAKTPPKKVDVKKLEGDAKEVDDLADSLAGERSGVPAKLDGKSLKEIEEMVGKGGNTSDFKKMLSTDANIAKAFYNGGLTVYDLLTYTSTGRLWPAIAFLTVGSTFIAAAGVTFAAKGIYDLGKFAVKTIGKMFKAHKGTAEKAFLQKYRDSVKKGTKTTDKLIEILGKEQAEAYEALKEMGESIPEIESGLEEPLNVTETLREIGAEGLSKEEKRARIEKTEKRIDTAEKAQKGMLEDGLRSMRNDRAIADLKGLDIPDIEPEALEDFITYAKVDEEGKIILPNNSEIREEDLEELTPEARKRLVAVLSMPRIEDLSDEQLIKLGKAVRVVEVEGEEGKKLSFDEEVLGEDETLLKISKVFTENPDILPENLSELGDKVARAGQNIEVLQAARRAVVADHKLEIAQSIKGQFLAVKEMSKQYTEKGRASEDGLSKAEQHSRKAIREVAMAKVAKMSRRSLTDVIKSGDDAEKTIHEQAEGILLKDLLEVEQTQSRKLDRQTRILDERNAEKSDPEDDLEII